MSDTEKKIAEIRKSAEEARKTDRSWVDGQDYADDVQFLLDELERLEREYAEERAAHNAHVTELCQLEEKNRKLLEERDEARRKAEEAWKEIDSLEEQLLSAQQDRDKLIEGLRWYAYDIKYMNWPSELWINQGQRARDILREVGVTVE
jgi:Uncharacterized protein containing TOPRIM domain, potential nuclease